ncbi:MAG: hypothetical protein P8J87_17755, partial [Verrucomicrobiales bacterium]|nr:hypothetical protein [Verrucomicrobiales bacterium]
DATLPPILRLAFGSDAREFYLNHSHLIAGDATSASYSYAAWLPPGLPPGSYDWSVVTTDGTGKPGTTGKTPNSLERIPAGAPSLAVTNTADAEFGFARNIGDPPLLDTLTITPTTIDLSTASPEISGSLGFADDASGLAAATLFLTGPTTADHIKLPLLPADITSGNRSEGSIDFTFGLPPSARAGTWTVGVDLIDRAGNTTTYGGPAGGSLPPRAPEEITLANPPPTPPAPAPFNIAGFRFSTQEINLTDSPANVGFELDLTGTAASFTSATISATPFIAAAPQIAIATITPADLSSTDGSTFTYATLLHFPLGAIPGPWTAHLEVDGPANSIAADIGQIKVTSFGNIDTTTPTLNTLATNTPSIDVTGAPATTTFTLGLAGFAAPDTGYLSFSNPSHPTVSIGPFPFTTATRTAGDDTASTNTVDASFPAGTPSGTWYPHLTLSDPYYLSSSYGGTDPAAAPPFPAGVSDTVQVTDSGTPPYAAFVANHPALRDTSPTADPDHDNLPTLIELVLGTDPTVADFPSPLQLTTTATKLRLTFPVDRRALDTGTASPVTFSGQISTTLRTRNPLPARSLSGGLYRIE